MELQSRNFFMYVEGNKRILRLTLHAFAERTNNESQHFFIGLIELSNHLCCIHMYNASTHDVHVIRVYTLRIRSNGKDFHIVNVCIHNGRFRLEIFQGLNALFQLLSLFKFLI